MSIIDLDKKYVANTYARFPMELVSGKGSKLYDSNGKEYIDMGTGIPLRHVRRQDRGHGPPLLPQH